MLTFLHKGATGIIISNMKVSLIFIIILIISGLGIGIFTLSQINKPKLPSTTQNVETAVRDEQPVEHLGNSRYVEYSKEVLDRTAGGKRVLYFYANWCPTCRPADANFKANIDKIPEDLTLIRVNYNDTETDQEEEELAAKYGITYQHTFVQIDGNGEVITKWNGGQIEELLARIK